MIELEPPPAKQSKAADPVPSSVRLFQHDPVLDLASPVRNLILAIAALAAIAVALSRLLGATSGLAVTHTTVGTTPVTVFAPISGDRAPAVVIAHGFAGSQQLMQPFAVSLARNGFIAVTFDFLGHGRNPQPLKGSITETEGATTALIEEFAEVAAFARGLPASDGRLAVLGHSMASDIVVRYAQRDSDVAATVAVSMFSPVVTATSPRNLLVIVGALEPAALKNEALRIVAMAAGTVQIQENVTYGSVAAGTARRMAFSPGVEHIGVLYSRASLTQALVWLDTAFGRRLPDGDVSLDARGRWLGLLFLGLTVLAPPPFPHCCLVSPTAREGRTSHGVFCCRWPPRRLSSPHSSSGRRRPISCLSWSVTIWRHISRSMAC